MDRNAQISDGGTPRRPCSACTRKHLAQAAVLLQESVSGYPDHRWLAMGHLAEAEAEILGLYPDIAQGLRASRKEMEAEDELMPDFLAVISEISRREGGNGGGCGSSCPVHGNRSGRIADRLAREVSGTIRRIR